MATIIMADAPGTYGDHATVYAAYASDAESIDRAIADWTPRAAYYVLSASKGDRVARARMPEHLSREELRAWASGVRKHATHATEQLEIERAHGGQYDRLLDAERRDHGDANTSAGNMAAHRRLLARARQR